MECRTTPLEDEVRHAQHRPTRLAAECAANSCSLRGENGQSQVPRARCISTKWQPRLIWRLSHRPNLQNAGGSSTPNAKHVEQDHLI
jgi:hypothetical protein